MIVIKILISFILILISVFFINSGIIIYEWADQGLDKDCKGYFSFFKIGSEECSYTDKELIEQKCYEIVHKIGLGLIFIGIFIMVFGTPYVFFVNDTNKKEKISNERKRFYEKNFK